MKKYLWMLSAAIMIGAVRVKVSQFFFIFYCKWKEHIISVGFIFGGES